MNNKYISPLKESSVGIITMHYADNFGSVLQAYALQETLKKFGYSPEFINFIIEDEFEAHNYKIQPIKRLNKFGFIKGTRRILSGIYRYNHNLKRKKLFNEFRKKYLIINPTLIIGDKNIKKQLQYYDILVTGSDQVWNPAFILPDGKAYLLNFGTSNQKKYSYAASIAVAPLKMEQIDYSLISDFDGISIREEKQKNKLMELTGRNDIQVNIDPTFLLEKNEWLNLAEYKPMKRGYIFVYDFVSTQELIRFANKLAKKFDLDIISFSNSKFYINHVLWISECSPNMFLGLLNNATYSITSSFHGVALSIILEKNFIAFPHPTRGSRITGLLKLMGLENRLIYNSDDFEDFDFSDIDYSPIREIIKNEREKSYDYLKSFGENRNK